MSNLGSISDDASYSVSTVAPESTVPASVKLEKELTTFVRKLAMRYRAVRLKKDAGIYNAGDRDETVFFLEEGSVKVTVPTYAGRSCLLDIHQAPTFFGEASCASGERLDMAVARTSVVLRKIPCVDFIDMLKNGDVVPTFAAYVAARMCEHQELITSFVTCSAEERLAAMLLRIGRKLGRSESGDLCLRERLSCQELSEMVGTTRSRVGYFLGRFQKRNLLVRDAECRLRLRESRLIEFLNERS